MIQGKLLTQWQDLFLTEGSQMPGCPTLLRFERGGKYVIDRVAAFSDFENMKTDVACTSPADVKAPGQGAS